MNPQLDFRTNQAAAAEIVEHLLRCDESFATPLSARVDIDDYARKIAGAAQRFEVWAGGELVGLLAIYCNDTDRQKAFITNVSVLPGWQRKGIAARLLAMSLDHVRRLGFVCVELKVDHDNVAACALYNKQGFRTGSTDCQTLTMHLELSGRAA